MEKDLRKWGGGANTFANKDSLFDCYGMRIMNMPRLKQEHNSFNLIYHLTDKLLGKTNGIKRILFLYVGY